MSFNPLFILTVLLILLSAININASLEFKDSTPILSYIIGGVGILGVIAAITRLIIISIVFKWWWFFAFAFAGLLVIGIFSFLTRTKTSLVLGSINILLIPFVWWYGSNFNRILSYDWISDLTNLVKGFFTWA